ncbi:MAG TPA: hypothetical protein VGQ76_28565 [Thermoanaerobaculia bacterium]|jgi:hypothetical protein|nr:hypothetical protein [Thermoanaerobaculia bacterium]
MIEELAQRADRAMRTFSARNTAESAYSAVRDALLSAEDDNAETRVANALSQRQGWKRLSDRDFVCTFGDRSSAMTMPRPFDSGLMPQLITRIEVNVFLGDGLHYEVLRELQALAQRELQRLKEADALPMRA